MFNIRLAEDEDVEIVLDMGRKFYSTMEMAKMIPFDDEAAMVQIFKMLDDGFILLGEKDGEVVGMIGCSFFDYPFNSAFRGCAEVMFWIEPEHRGGTLAARFIREAELLSIHEGASFVVLAALETSPTGIDTFYNKLGYSRSERAFVKGV